MPNALIFGAGSGISASLARALRAKGYAIALASRSPEKLGDLATATGARLLKADSTSAGEVEAAFADLDRAFGTLDVVLYNAAARVRGPVAELDPAEVENVLKTTAFGGFLVARQAAKRMLARGAGTILLTGASASVKGYPLSAPFAMAKFALRGLAQSMARELHPKGVHVAHLVIDGGVRNAARGRVEAGGEPDSLLDPDAIAASCLHLIGQPRSAWTAELELRPWTEKF